MANVTISPNMSLPVPVPAVDPGPQWATDANACFSGIDSHNHTTGQGVQINPAGININTDLPMNANNLTTSRTVRFTAQAAALGAATDIGCIYEAGVDLYYNDGSGNQVRITQGGAVAGSTGTITGLPSGTASASFSAGTFSFQSSTSTPATMNIGPIVTGAQTASPKTVTISASGAQAANYAMTWPLSLPAGTQFFTLDASGNMGTTSSGVSGSGAVVLQSGSTLVGPSITLPGISSPSFTGTSTGTITGALYSATVVDSSGTSSSLNNVSYLRINNRVTVTGNIVVSTNNSSYAGDLSLPVNPTANFTHTYDVIGTLGYTAAPPGITRTDVVANVGNKLARITLNSGTSVFSTSINFTFSYSCA